MVAKQVQLLHEVVPKATVVGFLVNHTSQNAVEGWTQMERAAQSLGLSAVRVEASKEADFDACFATLVQNKVEGLVIGPDPFFTRARERIIGLASRHNIPSINNTREFSTSGGLISYGTSVVEANYQAGIYVARILNGTKPSDLPVQQSTKVELIINLKAAKSLGIAFPISLLGRADEVIE
jgi:putative ABC transport system substrate-binding protein